MDFENTVENIIEKTLGEGATACDVVLAASSGKSISCRKQKIEDIEESNEKIIGIRALINQKQAFVSSSQIDKENLSKLVTKCVSMAKQAPEDDTAVLGDPSLFETNLTDLDLFQENETETQKLVDSVLECEDAALSVEGISNSEGAGASFSTGEFFLATSNGFRGGYKSSGNSISCSVLAGEGQSMERDYESSSAIYFEDLPSPASIGKKAANQTLKRLNPKKVASCKVPVVFDKRISKSLVGYLAGAISGPAIARGTSFLKDHLHKQIFNKDISIIDDPKIVRGLGSHPFDGEGVISDKKEIISNGVLTGWLLNTSTAKKLGFKTTGHASRGIGSPPGVSPSNLYMTNGINSYDDMIASIKNGFYVTELIGMGVNLVTGDYSVGASGMWIENGQISYSVSEVTIASNLINMYTNLTAANDLEFKYRVNAPTIRIDGMTLAGK